MNPFAASQLSERICLGIDPSPELLAAWGLPDTALGAETFAQTCLQIAREVCKFVKFQVAFFERFGAAGFAVLEGLCKLAGEIGFCVIADAKRSDIGSSMAGYADAWLSTEAPFQVNGLTVSPFMGVKSMESLIETARNSHRTVFVLVATSNPEGRSIQAGSGRSLSFQILSELLLLEPNRQSLGVVIGGNLSLRAYGLQRIMSEDIGLPVLSPGYGFQGAKLQDCQKSFGVSANWVLPNIGRGVLLAGPGELLPRLRSCREELL